MKKLLLLVLFSLPGISFAQQSNPAYDLQRDKINTLLDNRAGDYGQYQESLTKRTGIFGLKTKKDMQRSIDILSGIIETDNNILRETKVLLDYKDLEKTRVEIKATNVEERVNAYMATITKLQQQNEQLKAAAEKADSKNSKLQFGLFACIAIILILLFVAKNKLKGR
ncbi:hypothetical protein [Hufsiella ginkgonis]|uniref:Histidine kinase n=1 Tax=Hufsiella ginkgonis TaxID=2695274 RepID=A0A7K1XWY3_9SPHI|nr:hypothetical protein [Hufsiella ginkgonis]MXV15490.1 hypothetical protein [Hufsiella ginkgonis]